MPTRAPGALGRKMKKSIKIRLFALTKLFAGPSCDSGPRKFAYVGLCSNFYTIFFSSTMYSPFRSKCSNLASQFPLSYLDYVDDTVKIWLRKQPKRALMR